MDKNPEIDGTHGAREHDNAKVVPMKGPWIDTC